METLGRCLKSVQKGLYEVTVIYSVACFATMSVDAVLAMAAGQISIGLGVWAFSSLHLVFDSFGWFLVFSSWGVRELGSMKYKHDVQHGKVKCQTYIFLHPSHKLCVPPVRQITS